jgi:hypothetical protein
VKSGVLMATRIHIKPLDTGIEFTQCSSISIDSASGKLYATEPFSSRGFGFVEMGRIGDDSPPVTGKAMCAEVAAVDDICIASQGIGYVYGYNKKPKEAVSVRSGEVPYWAQTAIDRAIKVERARWERVP